MYNLNGKLSNRGFMNSNKITEILYDKIVLNICFEHLICTFAWSNETARFEVRSDLLPTKSLFTFSEAYLDNNDTCWDSREQKPRNSGSIIKLYGYAMKWTFIWPVDFVQPLFHVVKALQISSVVNHNNAVSTPVITRCDGAEPLLSGSIPLW